MISIETGRFPVQENSKFAFGKRGAKATRNGTFVAEMITELIRFEPEICICNGN